MPIKFNNQSPLQFKQAKTTESRDLNSIKSVRCPKGTRKNKITGNCDPK